MRSSHCTLFFIHAQHKCPFRPTIISSIAYPYIVCPITSLHVIPIPSSTQFLPTPCHIPSPHSFPIHHLPSYLSYYPSSLPHAPSPFPFPHIIFQPLSHKAPSPSHIPSSHLPTPFLTPHCWSYSFPKWPLLLSYHTHAISLSFSSFPSFFPLIVVFLM